MKLIKTDLKAKRHFGVPFFTCLQTTKISLPKPKTAVLMQLS
jgi:hypothetical protein